MKRTILTLVASILSACALAPRDTGRSSQRSEDERTGACKRSPYCSTTKPDTMTPDRREAELRGVREAVEEAQKP